MTVFADIYAENRWNGVESLSGPGSGTVATVRVAAAIAALVDELEIRSVLDAACGDGYWMPDLPGYLGIDIAPAAIERARVNHPDRAYVAGNFAARLMPAFDLVILRDVVQHLSFKGALAALRAVRRTRSRWLLASTYVGGENADIVTGDHYSPNLEAEPFVLGPPERLIFDGYTYHDPDAIRDPRKHLGLWSLTP